MERHTHTIDATGIPLGRLATRIAMLLRGKNKVTFSPHADEGDIVIVTNAKNVAFTGRKLAQKDLRHHSMHPGGLKVTPLKIAFEKSPADVVRHAVNGMLPKNSLRERMMLRLRFEK